MVTTMIRKELYTYADLLNACNNLSENELETIWKQFDLCVLLEMVNVEKKNRDEHKKQMSDLIRRELNTYDAIIKLYDMLPAIDYKMYINEETGQNEKVCSDSACDNQADMVK